MRTKQTHAYFPANENKETHANFPAKQEQRNPRVMTHCNKFGLAIALVFIQSVHFKVKIKRRFCGESLHLCLFFLEVYAFSSQELEDYVMDTDILQLCYIIIYIYNLTF